MPTLSRLADHELGPMEAVFVKGDAEVSTRSTIVMLVRLDRTVGLDVLIGLHERASRLVPHLRRRVVAPVLPISRPYWAIDPDFDIGFHVRHVVAPGGGSEEALMRLVESLGATPVDSARPLWDLTLIDGLADGTSALLYKLHHAISDGQGLSQIMLSIFSTEPTDGPFELPPLPAAEDVTRVDLTRQRLSELPLQLAFGTVSTARAAIGLVPAVLRRPRHSASTVSEYGQSLVRTARPPNAHPSPLLSRRGLRRHYATLRVPLEDLRSAARAMKVSLNSAYVAGVLGGVARYHEQHGVEIPDLPIAMPVSIRKPDDPLEQNRFVGVRISGPLSGATPAERAVLVDERVRTARAEVALEAVTVIAPAMSLLPMWLTGSLMSAVVTDLQVSNVASVPGSTYLGPAKVTGYYGFAPVAGTAAMIVMTSSDGWCDIGVNMDADAVTDSARFAAALEESFAELVAVGAEASTAPGPGSRQRRPGP